MEITLSHLWKYVEVNYEIQALIGQGSFGQVVKAQHKATGEIRAIKMIPNIFSSLYSAKKVVREI